MTRCFYTAIAVAALWLSGGPAAGETWVEAWRSPFGTPRAVSVNTADGSVWAVSGGSVLHLAEDGTILSQTNGFLRAQSLSVNPSDGSCWVADTDHAEIVHLADDGSEIWRYGAWWIGRPISVSVNPSDGSCWVADSPAPGHGSVLHFAEDGTELSRLEDLWGYEKVSVNPSDGSCWVTDFFVNQVTGQPESRVLHVASDGTLMAEITGLVNCWYLCVDPCDGSCWVSESYFDVLLHFGPDGTLLGVIEGVDTPRSISVNAQDGSLWVDDAGSPRVLHLAADGSELCAIGPYVGVGRLQGLSVNPLDGSCWFVDTSTGGSGGESGSLTHVDSECNELLSLYSRQWVEGMNVADGSVWLGVSETPPEIDWIWHLLHLAEDGTELCRTRELRDSAGSSGSNLSVNPADGSVWQVILETTDVGVELLRRFAADCTDLPVEKTFLHPQSVSSVQSDGSCWIADSSNGEVVHLSTDGQVLLRQSGFLLPTDVAASPMDGTCWVYDYNSAGNGRSELVHISTDGTELWRGEELRLKGAIAVNPSDGSCWAGDAEGKLIHVDQHGLLLWSSTGFGYIIELSVDPNDGSCWVADWGRGVIFHLAEDGTELCRVGTLDSPRHVSVNPTDGSCWVAATEQLVILDKDCSERLRLSGFQPGSVSFNEFDGSCWVVDVTNNEVVRFSEDGTEICRADGFWSPNSVSASPIDGSCWVADTYNDQVVLLNAECRERRRRGGFCDPCSVSVNPTDSSCWIADRMHNQIAHLSGDTSQLWRGTGFNRPEWVSVNPVPGSCWVADTGNAEVVHLAEDGSEIWRGGEFSEPCCVSVNPTDGSCWVSDRKTEQVIHLSEDGTELWRSAARLAVWRPTYVTADAADSSCWVAYWMSGEVVHLAEDGTELWRREFDCPGRVHLRPSDGSWWFNDSGQAVLMVRGHTLELNAVGGSIKVNGSLRRPPWSGDLTAGQTATLEAVPDPCYQFVGWSGDAAGAENPVEITMDGDKVIGADFLCASAFPDVPCDQWACGYISACFGAKIVSGYPDGSYHPGEAVNRAQMAVYISRALAGGDDNVPHVTDTPTFSDVDAEHWALDYIEYAAAQNVVAGYEDGTYRPEEPVDRGQMAVFVARAKDWVGINDDMTTAPQLFPDVPEGFWAGTAIEECVGHGVVQGYNDGYYRPDWTVTRDQMAVFVTRAFDLTL